MKNIAIIPARGGSKRLPGKNILLLGGIPLIAHSILYARANSAIIDEIYVTTDDAAIGEVALAFGAKVIARPDSISGDLEPTVSALKHVLENCGETVSNVILLQPTNPLRPEHLLADCFEIYLREKSESLFTVTENHRKFGKIAGNRFIPFNYEPGQRSQDLEPLFFENGLLYISSAKLISEDKIISENACPVPVSHAFADVDIDVQEDLEYAEFLMSKFNDKR